MPAPERAGDRGGPDRRLAARPLRAGRHRPARAARTLERGRGSARRAVSSSRATGRTRPGLEELVPSERCQVTAASPSVSTATWESYASRPDAESVCTGLSAPAAERVRAWIREWAPSERCQVNTASPSASTATWGKQRVLSGGREDLHAAQDAGGGAGTSLDPPVGPVGALPGEDGVAVGVDRDLGVGRGLPSGRQDLDRAQDAGRRSCAGLDSAGRGVRPGEDGVAVGVDRDLGLVPICPQGLDRAQDAGGRSRAGLIRMFPPLYCRQVKTASPSASTATLGKSASCPTPAADRV